MFYTKSMTKEMMYQLQVLCTGHHTISLLELQEKMRTKHVTTEMIPQYIVALEKAQLHAERADMPIPDNCLMMFATKAMCLNAFPGPTRTLKTLTRTTSRR